MNHSFFYSLMGILMLMIIFLIVYHYYRKCVAQQALTSLRGDKSLRILSLSSFLTISFISLVVLSVVIVYTDITISARNYVQNCALESDDGKTCVNSMGRRIFAGGVDPDIREQYKDYEKRDDHFYTSLNSYLFHNVVIKTSDSNFIIDDKVAMKIVYVGKRMMSVEYTNIGNDVYVIEGYRPINVWFNKKMVPFSNLDEITQELKSGESVVIDYRFDSDVEYVRIYKNDVTFERGIR